MEIEWSANALSLVFCWSCLNNLPGARQCTTKEFRNITAVKTKELTVSVLYLSASVSRCSSCFCLCTYLNAYAIFDRRIPQNLLIKCDCLHEFLLVAARWEVGSEVGVVGVCWTWPPPSIMTCPTPGLWVTSQSSSILQ